MKTNGKGISLIKTFEDCKLRAYLCPKGIPTIGYGNTRYEDGAKVRLGDVISKNRADALFYAVLSKFEQDVTSLVKVKLNDNQFSALVSFAWNCGSDIDADTKAEGLGDSTLLKFVNANPNNPAIRTEFMKWISKGTPYEKGLRRRRTAEADLYFTK